MTDPPDELRDAPLDSTKNCGYCGRANESAATHCSGCGTAFPEGDEVPYEKGSLRAGNATWILILYVIANSVGAVLPGLFAASSAKHRVLHEQIPAVVDKLMPLCVLIALLAGG